ncbi:MAG TPA: FAD-linked oxidase C-terminal domain-containing protein [Candidatus Angelobacter sp.]
MRNSASIEQRELGVWKYTRALNCPQPLIYTFLQGETVTQGLAVRQRARAAQEFPRDRTEALAVDLSRAIAGEVRFDEGSRALYSNDGSNYRQVPIGVVIPRTIEEVAQTVALARQYGAPILARGGGTSLAGQCCNVAVVIDFSKYLNQITEFNPQEKFAWVQPGVVLDHLRNRANRHDLTFGPDPSTHEYCNLGGMIGNNSCGVHSVLAGRTVDNVLELDVLTYDGARLRVGPTSDTELQQIIQKGGREGEIYSRLRALRDKYSNLIRARYPKIPRRVSGYSLDELLPEKGFHVARALVGSECTCVITLGAKVRLVDWPKKRSLVVLGFPSIYDAAEHVPAILEARPIGLEGMDQVLIDNMTAMNMHVDCIRQLPEGRGWLLVEFGGETKQESDDKAKALMAKLQRGSQIPRAKFCATAAEEQMMWRTRESGLGATSRVPGHAEAWEGWEDAAVAPENLAAYLRGLHRLLEKHRYPVGALYGHFGDGCVHTRIEFDLFTEEGIKTFRRFMEEAADLVVGLGGTLSGEHGDGQARGELLEKMYGQELMEAFREFKRIWDPEWKMNPGKKIDPYKLDENLRFGADYNAQHLKTYFSFPNDHGGFADATARCVGVSKCRKDEKGTMCPSYMATREEMHSTRGRARLLFEMLEGDPLRGGWKSNSVHEALDLCLACKACKTECPLNVDMASYKAEFLAHHYEGRLRPLSAYAMGLIHQWARMAAPVPWLANLFTQTPGLSRVAKFLAGVSQQRKIPKFARKSFKSWFNSRGACNQDKPQVLLWPDTFSNYFRPQIAQAAVEVLEQAGYKVIIPEMALCCGRPLYDFGMLDKAKQLLQQIVDALRPQIEAGIPVVGLEPSCISVFRDEMTNLLGRNANAERLKQQTFLLSELLVTKTDYHPPQLRRKALVHGHCHHKSVLKFDSEQELLRRIGLDFQVLDSGCCGMAGSFGFEKEKYDISVKIGERVLLPAVRNADPETLIIADGFSCFEQIEGLTGRRPLHIVEVMQSAIKSS